MMNRLIAPFVLLLAVYSHAAAPKHDPNISEWQESPYPRPSDRGAYWVWFYAANRSDYHWDVRNEGELILARLRTDFRSTQGDRPKFHPKAGKFREASTFAKVDDGWLVGFNEGEFGSALYWFDSEGKRSYEISGHQVIDFFVIAGRFYAIEGLDHMGMSDGSVIRITKSKRGARWVAALVSKLPQAPCAVSLRRDGTMLITLSQSLVSVDLHGKVRTLLRDAPWGATNPSSSALSRDEQRLYIGMSQFVGEFDLASKKFRFLIPSKGFLNKLPKDEEARIRKVHGG